MLQTLAGLCAVTGREAEALAMLQQVTAIQDRHITQFFSIVGDKHHIAYAQGLGEAYARILSLVLREMSQLPEAVHAAFDLVLRRIRLFGYRRLTL